MALLSLPVHTSTNLISQWALQNVRLQVEFSQQVLNEPSSCNTWLLCTGCYQSKAVHTVLFIIFGMCCSFQYSVPVGRACHSCLCMTLYLHMDRYICSCECALAQTRLQPWLVYPVWEDYRISSNGVWFWIVSWLPVPHPVFPPHPDITALVDWV